MKISNFRIHKIILLLIVVFVSNSEAQKKRKILSFEFEKDTLHGVLNEPSNVSKGIVLIVHGSGKTNAVLQEWYLDVRETFLKAGYSTYMWDKKGCGKSEGVFNYNQTVQNSASEVLAAINALKEKEIEGKKNIGLWGISRAGWISPIVIDRYKDIRFWVSVSGVDTKENFKYLLEQNLKIYNYSKDSIDIIVSEWLKGTKLAHSGAKFETYKKVTPNLRKNKFWLRFTNGGITEKQYYANQKKLMKEKLDNDSGLQIYIDDFESVLKNIECPVLALFGEKDMNVDWNKTQSLYKRTMGNNKILTIKSFENCNHNFFQCKTGGFYEIKDNNLSWNRCNGFLDSITNWLKKIK